MYEKIYKCNHIEKFGMGLRFADFIYKNTRYILCRKCYNAILLNKNGERESKILYKKYEEEK